MLLFDLPVDMTAVFQSCVAQPESRVFRAQLRLRIFVFGGERDKTIVSVPPHPQRKAVPEAVGLP